MAPPRSSSSTDKLDSTTAEYDHIIRQKSRLANQRMVRAGSSSDDSDPGVGKTVVAVCNQFKRPYFIHYWFIVPHTY